MARPKEELNIWIILLDVVSSMTGHPLFRYRLINSSILVYTQNLFIKSEAYPKELYIENRAKMVLYITFIQEPLLNPIELKLAE
jgi:hypothetical protein